MRIAVTGGSGALGRSLVPSLLEQGHSVVSIDRSMPSVTLFSTERRPEYIVADVRDFGELVASLRGCDALVHLAAYINPRHYPEAVLYAANTVSSYNALSAAATLGIKRVCLASSINAIGGVYSRSPRYDYFPLDEGHPSYAEEPYSLSKWVLEQQADAFARRYEWMSIGSLRFHWLLESHEHAIQTTVASGAASVRHLWAYTLLAEGARACLLALTADFAGHEVFYIVAPRTAAAEPSLELARTHYPNTAVRGDLSGHKSFFDCSKAERLLGWKHEASPPNPLS